MKIPNESIGNFVLQAAKTIKTCGYFFVYQDNKPPVQNQSHKNRFEICSISTLDEIDKSKRAKKYIKYINTGIQKVNAFRVPLQGNPQAGLNENFYHFRFTIIPKAFLCKFLFLKCFIKKIIHLFRLLP